MAEGFKKILLGMSGGVDSSVSAILLKRSGYDVIGVTMKLWEEKCENKGSCCNLESTLDAKRVCDKIGIPHYTLNFQERFQNSVIDNFIKEYSNCRTPNPCIECNKHLKFDEMYKKANELDIKYIATGHYAKIEYSEKYKRYVIKKAKNIKKDQSYVLYGIPKEMLKYIIFPLGNYDSKEQIRQIAKENNLLVADKPDSEDICFVPDGNYKKFLEENSNIQPKSGKIVDKDGNILGEHTGLYKYTIGQRRGLGISNLVPLFVIGFNMEKNEIIVGKEEDLYKRKININNINLQAIDELKKPMRVNVKTRYTAKEAVAVIMPDDKDSNQITILFDDPQRALTNGQSAVFYDEDGIVIGGGIIC